MSKFQLILIGVFAAFIVIGVVSFSFAKGSSKTAARLVMWGTIPQEVFQDVYSKSLLYKDKTVSLQYIEKNQNTFNDEFINALASGVGPDMVFLSQEDVLRNRTKLFVIPYASYSERSFTTNYVESAGIFLEPLGVLAIPVTIDPLIMYWNRDTFTNNSYSQPPAFWDQFYNLSQKLTVKDGAFNITKATVALGEFKNVTNAKDIISTLLFQGGTPITTREGGKISVTLDSSQGLSVAPGIAALTFFTEFSNPSKTHYSWNRSLPDSQSMFVSGDLALYFGFASEYTTIKLKNPNLNFDVAPMPQSRNVTKKITFGRLGSLAIVKNSKNIGPAYTAVISLSSSDTSKKFAEALNIPSARRDLLSNRPTDLTGPVFYDSALWSMAWLDPNKEKTSVIFQSMIEQITGGKVPLDRALNQANRQLQNII